jgi:ATP-dependent exoDNAse (exonuclease V) alpha subunit
MDPRPAGKAQRPDDHEIVVDGNRKHLDLGYVLTSHASQGQTADRVILNADTDWCGERLLNRRTTYVACSRGRADIRIYCPDIKQLAHALSRDVSKQSALRPDQVRTPHDDVRPAAAYAPEVS